MEGQHPGNGWSWVREVYFGYQGKVPHPEGAGTAQAPQGMGTALRLPELQEGLDTRDAQGGIAGIVLCRTRNWSQSLWVPSSSGYSMIL